VHCREPRTASPEELDHLAGLYLGTSAGADAHARQALVAQWHDAHADTDGRVLLYRSRGCDHCDGHGYHGRMGIHELMLSGETVRAHIRRRESAAVLQADAKASGMKTLRQDGIAKVLVGLTDLPEVLAATSE
jgi:type II secretory ATPase GspE/PulE/Tfp pilus assembly ATPase PilB-like protein